MFDVVCPFRKIDADTTYTILLYTYEVNVPFCVWVECIVKRPHDTLIQFNSIQTFITGQKTKRERTNNNNNFHIFMIFLPPSHSDCHIYTLFHLNKIHYSSFMAVFFSISFKYIFDLFNICAFRKKFHKIIIFHKIEWQSFDLYRI